MARCSELLVNTLSVIGELDPAEAAQRLAAGVVLIDVREADEVSQSSIAGSIHISRGILETTIESKGPVKETELVAVYAVARAQLSLRNGRKSWDT